MFGVRLDTKFYLAMQLTSEAVSVCMFLFGLTTCLQGLVQNYSGIIATRFFLGEQHYSTRKTPILIGAEGTFESGMFPGCFYLLAM